MTALSLARRLAGVCLAATTMATAALAVSAAPAYAQSRAELDKVLRRKVLANGMEVIVVENHGVPIATLEINVRNGAFTQSPEDQ